MILLLLDLINIVFFLIKVFIFPALSINFNSLLASSKLFTDFFLILLFNINLFFETNSAVKILLFLFDFSFFWIIFEFLFSEDLFKALWLLWLESNLILFIRHLLYGVCKIFLFLEVKFFLNKRLLFWFVLLILFLLFWALNLLALNLVFSLN